MGSTFLVGLSRVELFAAADVVAGLRPLVFDVPFAPSTSANQMRVYLRHWGGRKAGKELTFCFRLIDCFALCLRFDQWDVIFNIVISIRNDFFRRNFERSFFWRISCSLAGFLSGCINDGVINNRGSILRLFRSFRRSLRLFWNGMSVWLMW